jgi:hypothetical protein
MEQWLIIRTIVLIVRLMRFKARWDSSFNSVRMRQWSLKVHLMVTLRVVPVYIHDGASGKQILKQVHKLDVSPEPIHTENSGPVELKASPNEKGIFILSAWTFVGGPPTIPNPVEGWHQVAPSHVTIPPVPGSATFDCEGSAHGSTGINIQARLR